MGCSLIRILFERFDKMNKSNFNKKMIISVAGAALLSIGFAGMNGQDSAINATTVSAKIAKSKVAEVNSTVYQKIGKKVVKTSAVIKAGNKVTIYGKKTIKGVAYYEIGKGQYIKATNVDGKNHKLAKSTFLYTRSGKAIKGSKMAKGKLVKTFGKAITINGKKFYATKHGYVPAKALAVKHAPVDDVPVPAAPTAPTTPTTPSDNTSIQKPSNTTNNTTNIINGSGSSSNSNINNVQSVKWQGQDLKLDDNGVLTIPASTKPIDASVTILSALNNDSIKPDSVKEIQIGGQLTLTGKADELFSSLHKLTDITGLDKVDTSGVTSMQSMFYGCHNLKSLDLSSFDTSKVTDMHSMFGVCDNLAEIKFGEKFNTANVTDMHRMFGDCHSLTTLDLSRFNTSKVKNMHQMFAGAKQLKNLDLSNFDTTKVTDMTNMFATDKLDELNLGSFNVSDSAHVSNAFMGASVAKLTVSDKAKKLLQDGGLDLSNLHIDLNNLPDTATTYPQPSPKN